ncbi:uncharacterized protein LOC128234373 [Mya arenaria]|uniref:uncharacterized protein LOC128234373 n=1 Tax=Mya arenaria TaxID=6604 RepID=UPI0022E13857|nr:uncharacterized protein LOC128234373 [Mya arenaria]
MKELFTYVEDQWMESSLWSTTEWSVYRQTIRTNNDTEGWHRRLNFSAGRSTLQFYVLLSLLLRESKMVKVTHQLVSEAALGRQRRERYRYIDARIMDEWDSYDSHEVNCEEFLKNPKGQHKSSEAKKPSENQEQKTRDSYNDYC